MNLVIYQMGTYIFNTIWQRHLQEELGVTNTGLTLIFKDDQGVISTAKNPVFHK